MEQGALCWSHVAQLVICFLINDILICYIIIYNIIIGHICTMTVLYGGGKSKEGYAGRRTKWNPDSGVNLLKITMCFWLCTFNSLKCIFGSYFLLLS